MKISPWIIAGAAFALLYRIFKNSPRVSLNEGIIIEGNLSNERVSRPGKQAKLPAKRVGAKGAKTIKKIPEDKSGAEPVAVKTAGTVKKKANSSAKGGSRAAAVPVK
jgi:hypothetical protein